MQRINKPDMRSDGFEEHKTATEGGQAHGEQRLTALRVQGASVNSHNVRRLQSKESESRHLDSYDRLKEGVNRIRVTKPGVRR